MSDSMQDTLAAMQALASMGSNTTSDTKSDLPLAHAWVNPGEVLEGTRGKYFSQISDKGCPITDEAIAKPYIEAVEKARAEGKTSCIVMVPCRVTVPGSKQERGTPVAPLQSVEL